VKRYSLNSSKFLSPHELERLTRVLDAHINRDTLMICLALATGARATELLNITFQDVNHEHRSILIKGIKGSDDREIPLTDILFHRLEKYLREIQSPKSCSHQNETTLLSIGPIFRISYSRLKAIWVFYRPVNKGFHSLRHTFAINLYRKTQDLRLLKVALGHRNIANTMIYAEYEYSATELRRLIL